MRMTFPQDRTTFVHTGPLQPILTPPRTGIALYRDEQGSTPADVRRLDGGPLTDSTIHTGEDGLLPEFMGPPDGAVLLWAKVLGTTALYPLQARVSDMLAALVADLPGTQPPPVPPTPPILVSGSGPPTPAVGFEHGFYLDLAAAPVELWGPKTSGVWPASALQLAHDPPDVPRAFTHMIFTPSTKVTVDHPLSYPSVVYIDENGDQSFCDVTYPAPTRVVVGFDFPSTGRLELKP